MKKWFAATVVGISSGRFIAGLICGFVIAATGSASAAQEPVQVPIGSPVWPDGTSFPYKPPRGCEVVKRVTATKYGVQHRAVRELVIHRLVCDWGDRHRTVVTRGPWMKAFVNPGEGQSS